MTDLNSLGLMRVAVATPRLKVADVTYNLGQMVELAQQAAEKQAQVLVFPELSLTGYTIGDLVQQQIIQSAVYQGLQDWLKRTADLVLVTVIGLPLPVQGKIYNCAAVASQGKLLGLVPKTYLPNYSEFYEQRWYASAHELRQTEVNVGGQAIPIGSDLLFQWSNRPNVILGVEICEDVWAPLPPSTWQALAGATIIANPSASNELVGKAVYRRQLVEQQSARTRTAYLYAGSGVGESTTDLVFGGHSLIAENGSILAETPRLTRHGEMAITDIDLEHLLSDRARQGTFTVHEQAMPSFRTIMLPEASSLTGPTMRRIDAHPFVPQDKTTLAERTKEVMDIQTAGLATRLEHTGIKNLVIGLSGGLDSTLALLVTCRAAAELEIPIDHIYAFSMPGFATSNRTRQSSVTLAKALGVRHQEIDITEGCRLQLRQIGHSGEQDVTFENVQARYRTQILMNEANQLHGLVVGTGDLSELALGWSTYNGDHISHYNVNASVPKTLVKHVVRWAADQPIFADAHQVLQEILDTPISPELVGNTQGVSQKTEDIIGPYELHDFFIYHTLRWGSHPQKVEWLANQAFGSEYSKEEIRNWLTVFYRRFVTSQWKRSVATDGPKVGSVSFSPRGDWRMPSDTSLQLWLDSLAELPTI